MLGAMLLSRDAIAVVVEEVSAEDFYKPSHAHIYSAITSLYANGLPADIVTVPEQLRRVGVLDASGVDGRKQGRSLYGAKRPKKEAAK